MEIHDDPTPVPPSPPRWKRWFGIGAACLLVLLLAAHLTGFLPRP